MNRAALPFIFVTILLDVLSFGIIIPVLPKLIERGLCAASAYLLLLVAFVLFSILGHCRICAVIFVPKPRDGDVGALKAMTAYEFVYIVMALTLAVNRLLALPEMPNRFRNFKPADEIYPK